VRRSTPGNVDYKRQRIWPQGKGVNTEFFEQLKLDTIVGSQNQIGSLKTLH
jgi:hypothetical protein